MSLPEPFSSSRHLNSSPGQLSTVLDRDETIPHTSQMSQSAQSDNSKEDLESSRSTIPFPSTSNEQNDQAEEGSHTNFTPIIQALQSIIRTVSPSEDGNGRASGQPTPVAKPATPNQSPSPAPAVHPLFSLKSPSETHLRKLSSPLKPSMSNVDSLSSSRHEGGPKRVSFDHATSGPTVSMQNLTNVLQMSTNPPAQGSPVPNRSHTAQSTPTKGATSPRSGSRSRSQSPRRFWPLSRLSSPGEPWQPRDPYQLRLQLDQLLRRRETVHKCWDQILRQLYRHFLLRLPSAYFTRVSRVFEEAELSRVEVQKMIDASKRARTRRLRRGLRQAQSESHNQPADSVDFWPTEREWLTPVVSPSLQHFKQSWDEFMESLQKEWKTLNVVSALLLSAILTMFQVEGSDQPVIRTAALIALICALWSLTFGCIYILRFATMKSMHKASRWAEEAQKHTTGIWWNVWVFLALPSVFLAWSVISFCVAILSFSWTTGTPTPPNPISDSAAIGPRLGITFVFLLGLLYFTRAIKTLKKYADPLPRHWALHSPPPLAARDPGPVSELDLERAEGIALSNVKDAADRAEAEEEAQRSQKERGRGLLRAFAGPRW